MGDENSSITSWFIDSALLDQQGFFSGSVGIDYAINGRNQENITINQFFPVAELPPPNITLSCGRSQNVRFAFFTLIGKVNMHAPSYVRS